MRLLLFCCSEDRTARAVHRSRDVPFSTMVSTGPLRRCLSSLHRPCCPSPWCPWRPDVGDDCPGRHHAMVVYWCVRCWSENWRKFCESRVTHQDDLSGEDRRSEEGLTAFFFSSATTVYVRAADEKVQRVVLDCGHLGDWKKHRCHRCIAS